MPGANEWCLSFLGLGVLVACEADDQRRLFTDGDGRSWKERKRERLVQPDNMDERGPHTVVYRDVPALLASLNPDFVPLALPSPDAFALEVMPIYPPEPDAFTHVHAQGEGWLFV